MGSSLFSASAATPPAVEAHQPKDPLETVVELQAFDGYWKWTDELFAALGVDGHKICAQARTSSNEAAAALRTDLETPSEKLATAIVLAFLERKMKDRKDEWEMLAEKAYRWLEVGVSGTAVDFVKIVGELMAV